MDALGIPRECYSNKKAFRRIQYSVRLREFKNRIETKIDGETMEATSEDQDHELPPWGRDVLSRIQEIPSYDSDVSSIDNLEERETELEELDEDYSEKTKLTLLCPKYIRLPELSQLSEDHVPKFIMDAYDAVGSGNIIRESLREN